MTVMGLSKDVQVDLTLRNAKLTRNRHVQIKSLGVVLATVSGGDKSIIFPGHTATEYTGTLPSNSTSSAYLFQAYNNSYSTSGTTGSGTNYKPHIPKIDSTTYSLEGYEVKIGSSTLNALGTDTQAVPHGWGYMQYANGPQSLNLTVALKQMPYLWPGSIDFYNIAGGTGLAAASLWTDKNTYGYTFCWRQYESRTANFAFRTSNQTAALRKQVAQKLDWPLTGRASNYDYYDFAGVMPYRLLTVNEQNAAYDMIFGAGVGS
jgi:hypothetical protein